MDHKDQWKLVTAVHHCVMMCSMNGGYPAQHLQRRHTHCILPPLQFSPGTCTSKACKQSPSFNTVTVITNGHEWRDVNLTIGKYKTAIIFCTILAMASSLFFTLLLLLPEAMAVQRIWSTHQPSGWGPMPCPPSIPPQHITWLLQLPRQFAPTAPSWQLLL